MVNSNWLVVLGQLFLTIAISLDILNKRSDASSIVYGLMESVNCWGIDMVVVCFAKWLFFICAVTCSVIHKSLIVCTKVMRVIFIMLLLVYVFLQIIIV